MLKESFSPLVSIIIPVYNGENTIERAIKSALQQSYVHIEVIVVDNGSNDGTIELVKKLAVTDQRLHLAESKKGRSIARNKGLELARGKYINFLDADDCFECQHIERCVLDLESNSSDFAISEGTEIIFENKDRPNIVIQQKENFNIEKSNFLEISSVLFRNINIVPFLTSLEHNEDWLFWILNLRGKKIKLNFNRIGEKKFVTGNNTMKDITNMIGSHIIVFSSGNIELSLYKQFKLMIMFFKSNYSKINNMRHLVSMKYGKVFRLFNLLWKFAIFRFIFNLIVTPKINKLKKNSIYN
ncbi:glycosyltransferase family 2 protein [Leuconostoc lactis]